MTRAATKPAAAKASKKPSVTASATPEREEVVVKKTATAYQLGLHSAILNAKSLLMNSRSFGEAIDQLNQIEVVVLSDLIPKINAELKSRRVNPDDRNVTHAAHPEGPRLVLTAAPKTEAATEAAATAAPANSQPAQDEAPASAAKTAAKRVRRPAAAAAPK